jgi:CHAT domain-containing protein
MNYSGYKWGKLAIFTHDKLSLFHPFFWAPFVLVGEGE